MSRVSALCSLPVALSALVCAQAAEPIEWSKDFKLTQQHFRSQVPSSTRRRGAQLGCDSTWPGSAAKGAHAFTRAPCSIRTDHGGAVDRRTSGAASRKASRVASLITVGRPPSAIAICCAHEQLHFDLTEVAARKIRKQLDELVRICAVPGSRESLETDVAAIERAWTDEQARYDKDTDHGMNQVKQRQWDVRVRRDLELSSR